MRLRDRPPRGSVLMQLFRMVLTQFCDGLFCPSFFLFSIGLDSPMVGDTNGENEQEEGEKARK